METETSLWYRQPAPADKWTEALPIGNGRLGAMVFGGVLCERIQFNEESVWSGGFRNRNNPFAERELNKIRAFLSEGKIRAAEDLARYALSGTPEYQRAYQSLGDMHFRFHGIPEDFSGYERRLCLDEAIATTRFIPGGFLYEREIFASAPADVIVIRLSTSNPGGMSFDCRLVRNRLCETTGAIGTNGTFLSGANGGADGISFHWAEIAQSIGGEVEAIGEYLVFRRVRDAFIYTSAVTGFRSENTLEQCLGIIRNAEKASYASLRAEHIWDYKELESRISISLGSSGSDSAGDKLPTDERLAGMRDGKEDLGLIALYFRYGRYLLISCSRPGTLPANLQGIWCEHFLPPWDSKYTININTQMNYWPAEICALPECHVPLFDHIRRMHPRGIETASEMYASRGFVAHHNTDIWGDCAPQDTWTPSTYWMLGAAWLCLHIWERYEYTLDLGFLDEHYDLIKDACLFFMDFLIENERGELVVSPSVSPENTYVLHDGVQGALCEGCAMDGQILTELFTACEQACRLLCRDLDFAAEVAAMRCSLPPARVGENGGIMEWLVDREEAEPGHRHISHLFALFPGSGISPEDTPALAEAARRTLMMRLSHGGGHTGWSRAWIANLWARLGDGNEAYHHLNELLRHSTLPSLLDDHPPFQIDGNFGATAAIAHMLLHSTPNRLHFLHALPDAWKCGSITGLRAKGGLTVDMSWENGLITQACITASHEYEGLLVCNGMERQVKLSRGERYSL